MQCDPWFHIIVTVPSYYDALYTLDPEPKEILPKLLCQVVIFILQLSIFSINDESN